MASPTLADHQKRLLNLTALYEQSNLSECIKQCEDSLKEHVGMAPYWRIKTYCLLVGANEDWEKAEQWRQAGKSVYAAIPRSERERLDELPFMKDLRESLDDLYAFQAEGAPSWFKAKEKLDHWVREGEIRHTTKPIGGDEDEDEDFDVDFDGDFDVEEQVAAQSDSTYEGAARTAVEVQEPADASKTKDEETQPGAAAFGGANKKSFGSTTKGILAKKVSKLFDKIQDMAPRLRSRASAMELLPPNSQDIENSGHLQRMRETAQSEMDALDAEDAFQESKFAAREARRKVLREKLRE